MMTIYNHIAYDFNDLQVGEIFLYHNDLYMKVSTIDDKTCAVNLKTGMVYSACHNWKKIRQVTAELTYK